MINQLECVLDLSQINGATIPYVAFTKEYGTAEFCVCAQWKRGKVQKIFIYPKQQPDTKFFYSANVDGISYSMYPFSWTHLRKQEPRPWLFTWCKEHKCMSMNIYVPRDTDTLRIVRGSALELIFE